MYSNTANGNHSREREILNLKLRRLENSASLIIREHHEYNWADRNTNLYQKEALKIT